MSEITLEPASGAERFCLHLRAHPGLLADRMAIAKVLGITGAVVDSALLPAIELGLVTVAADAELGRVWRAGPRLDKWRPAGVPLTVPAPAKQAPTASRRGRTLPAIDLSRLQVRVGVAPPIRRNAAGRTKHDALFDLLKADGNSVEPIGMAHMPALQKAAAVYLDRRPALKATSLLLVRRIDAENCGVWRMAKPAAAASAPHADARKAAWPVAAVAERATS